MVIALISSEVTDDNNVPKRLYVNKLFDLEIIKDNDIDHFINNQSLKLLQRCKLNIEFSQLSVERWLENKDYRKG